MTKQHFSLSELIITTLAISVVILSLAIFYGINMGMSHQAQLNDALNVKSQVNDEIVEDINNDKALQLNSSNNEINQFMIHEFKNIYRVKA